MTRPLAAVLTATLLTLSAGPALAQEALRVSPATARPAAPGPAASFTGSVSVTPLFPASAPSRTSGVTFQPGARSAWHTHPLGQTLIVTAGDGFVQSWGEPAHAIRPGDGVTIPPGVKHWHGAAPDSALTHTAIQEADGGRNVDWLEPVSDQQYRTATAPPRP